MLAALLYGAALSLFLDPHNLAPGGFSGIAILLNRFFPAGVGVWFLILNIPVLLIGLYKFGWKFIVSTVYTTVLIGFFTDLIAKYFGQYAIDDMILAVVFGSILMGTAIGIAFLSGATTGGSDIIVRLLRLKFPHIRSGQFFFMTDIAVITAAGLVFRDVHLALYALISVFLTGYVLDLVLYGRDGAKLIYIISDKSSEISARLLTELGTGATFIDGKGAYSGKDKDVILCVIKKHVYPLAEEIIREEDPDAFLIISSASEIFGEGYKSYFDERL